MISLIALFLAPAFAGSGTAPSVTELAARSSSVVRGVVVGEVTEEDDRGLRTTYEVRVEQRLAGDAADLVHVTLPGGVLGDVCQTYAGVPLWESGDEVVVFLPEPGRAQSLLGVFGVDGDVLVDPWTARRDPVRAVSALEKALRTGSK